MFRAAQKATGGDVTPLGCLAGPLRTPSSKQAAAWAESCAAADANPSKAVSRLRGEARPRIR